MRLTKTLTVALATLAVVACAPRNTTHYLSIDEALNSSQAKEVLDPKIKLYFGKPAPGKTLVKGAITNPKTNALNKTDLEACQWAFLSAVKRFQERAQKEGGTKVGNLVSYYKKKEYSSTTKYECHAGRSIAGVALKGDIVK
ncbi:MULTISPECIES: excinuclease ABC subunit A [Glaesserella]|uniref:Excinuclease ABC subunit A n=1 Tax=Glaesserella australis TaxID=2094024 RepID=A0A328C0P5_9PAST|nr:MULTISPECIES: excinuclease ABC subunit A [Glaesserella]AUI66516.1 excinuclease ABC subunit A [Glaesserella sp. 15-184]RAL18690.1 excinuclease ABC subunit A [Glaesserella australis]